MKKQIVCLLYLLIYHKSTCLHDLPAFVVALKISLVYCYSEAMTEEEALQQ
jgi:hypothetical protein